jgi:sugar/nucleoside kinase (ribokinase family)
VDTFPARRHVLYVQGDQIGPLAELLPRAHDGGLLLATHTTRLAQEWRSPTALGRLCSLFDLVVLNREVACDSTGSRDGTAELVRHLQAFADAAAKGFLLILTLGAEGALLLRPCRQSLHEPSPPVRPVDTAGAGDTFSGCFLAAWANQVDPDLALRMAVHGASRSTESRGAQEHGLRGADLASAGEKDRLNVSSRRASVFTLDPAASPGPLVPR